MLLTASTDAAAGPDRRGVPDQHLRDLEQRRIEARQAERPRMTLPRLSLPTERLNSAPLFLLRGVTLSGNTAIGTDELNSVIKEFIGRSVSERDLWQLTQYLTKHYQERGYFLTRVLISPQDPVAGRLNVTIVEGYVADIRLEGEAANRYGLQLLLGPIARERPLRLATFERQLLLASDTPGVRIADSSIEDMDPRTGAFRLTVRVETWKSSAWAGVDNRAASGTGPTRWNASIGLNSGLSPGDSIGINLATTQRGFGELIFGGVTGDVLIGADGSRFGFYATRSDSAPKNDLPTKTSSVGLQISAMPIRSLDATMRVSASLGATWAVQADGLPEGYDDAIYTGALGFEFQAPDKFGGRNYLSAFVRQGFDAFDASERWQLKTSRFDASGEFIKAGFAASRVQPLGGPWSMRVAAAGQISGDPLLSSEQFYLGGSQYGRGFTNGEIGADQGIAALAELRYDLPTLNTGFKQLQMFGFVDGGALADRGPDPATYLPVYSAGAGFRFGVGEFTGQIEVAVPFGGYARTDALERHARIFFTLSTELKGCPTSIVCARK